MTNRHGPTSFPSSNRQWSQLSYLSIKGGEQDLRLYKKPNLTAYCNIYRLVLHRETGSMIAQSTLDRRGKSCVYCLFVGISET